MTDEATTSSVPNGITRYGPSDGVPRFLSDVIIDLGLAEAGAVEQAVEAARGSGETVGAVLVRQGLLTEDQLARAIAARYGLDHVDLNEFEVDPSAANLLPPAAAQRYRAVPVCFQDDGSLLVALADPSDSLALSDIAFMTKLDVCPAVASADLISVVIQKLPMRIPAGSEQSSPVAGGSSAAPTVSPPQTSHQPTMPPGIPSQSEPPGPDPRIEALEAELAETVSALEAQREAHAAEVDELRNERDAKAEELERLRGEAEAARAEASARAEELDAARAEASARSPDLEAARAEAARRADELDAARAEASALAAELEAAKADAARRAEELERARAEMGERHERLEGAEAEASSLREELEAARARESSLREQLDAVTAEASSLRDELEAARSAASSAAEQLAAAERRAQDAEGQAEELAAAERLANEAREMIGRMRHEFELEREAYAANERDLRSKLAAAEEESERLGALLGSARRVADQFARGADELRSALDGENGEPEAPVYEPQQFVD